MPNYHEIMTTDLGLLTAAADKWDAMAGELKKVETRYGDSVQKITMGRNWSGVSAGVAHTSFAATRYEYTAAQSQAKATATLLRTAHEALTDLKKKLESARADAIAMRHDRLGPGTRGLRPHQAHARRAQRLPPRPGRPGVDP